MFSPKKVLLSVFLNNAVAMKTTSTVILLIFLCAACTVRTAQENIPLNKFADPVLQQIHTFQDERKTAPLLDLLEHKNNLYRKEAALALASVQDTVAIPRLAAMLRDSSLQVRKAAAYALGQMRHENAEQPLITVAATETTPAVLAEMLAAAGKNATVQNLPFYENFNSQDTAVMAGLSEAIYRAGLRQVSSEKLLQKTLSLLGANNSYETRFWAAHALARHSAADLSTYGEAITKTALNDPEPEVRIAATQALTKVNGPDKAAASQAIYNSNKDYRVRISALKALKGLEFEQAKQLLLPALQDTNDNVLVTAAAFIQENAPARDTATFAPLARQIRQPRAKASLYAYLLKSAHNKQALREEIIKLYQSTDDVYLKGFLLEALQQDVQAYDFIKEETFGQEHPVISTYGIESLIALRKQQDFPQELVPTFNNTIKQAITSNDQAMAGIAAGAITDSLLHFRSAFGDISFLKAARDRMVLPRDIEAYIALQAAINYMENKPAPAHPEAGFNHPIQWQQVEQIAANQLVQVRTSKGDFTLQLFVEDAPGSVASFVELVKQGFYDNKTFHRVVPNFVVQGGCPRGDGWGSSDYSLRSEFASLQYREGYVGLASAGKDTESCQWFVTHNATPHLDGRYTIFAKVVKGMDVVHQLSIGDRIEEVRLLEADKQ
jgi:cyclophilin family peptidyl-prolyl cis-trans isomerase/HEAT repeat protein